ASVVVARRAWGATALSSGAADVAPDPLTSQASPLGARTPIAECARLLALRRPDHPYAALIDRLPSMREALAFAASATGGLLSFADVGGENRVLLSPFGVFKQSAGALSSILAGDLLEAIGGTVGVVGFDRPGLDLDAPMLAAGLEEEAALAGLPLRALPIECEWPRWTDQPLLRHHEIAARIEEDPVALADAVERAMPSARCSLVLLPPVLSRGDSADVLRILEERLGVRCAELPAGARSVPGVRLQERLERRLREAGVRLVDGEVFLEGVLDEPSLVERPRRDWQEALRIRMTGGHEARAAGNGWAREGRGSVENAPGVSGGSRDRGGGEASLPIAAGACVLAAGKFIGGGVQRHGRLREPIFDLPIWVDGAVDEGRWLGDTTRHAFLARQPALAAGVRVDANLRPLLRDGSPFDDRVFACGGVLAGNDPAADGAGIGLAVFTGWLAGREAAKRRLPRTEEPARARVSHSPFEARVVDRPRPEEDRDGRGAGEAAGGGDAP
ncbi:MAG TPA: FAD-binding protein, partial [Vulgatibacter sp.]